MTTNLFSCGAASRRRAALALSGMLALGALSACSATRVAAPLSADAVRLDLPLVKQDELYACGLASISALAQYWGTSIPADERAELARTAAEKQGLSGRELRDALEGLGLETFVFRGSLDRSATGVYRSIDAGRPLLVMTSPDGEAHHYGLVLGYDAPRETLIVLDPMRGETLVPAAVFAPQWARCQNFTLLACPRPDAATSELATVPETAHHAQETNR